MRYGQRQKYGSFCIAWLRKSFGPQKTYIRDCHQTSVDETAALRTCSTVREKKAMWKCIIAIIEWRPTMIRRNTIDSIRAKGNLKSSKR